MLSGQARGVSAQPIQRSMVSISAILVSAPHHPVSTSAISVSHLISQLPDDILINLAQVINLLLMNGTLNSFLILQCGKKGNTKKPLPALFKPQQTITPMLDTVMV